MVTKAATAPIDFESFKNAAERLTAARAYLGCLTAARGLLRPSTGSAVSGRQAQPMKE